MLFLTKGYDLGGVVDFDLYCGLAMFVRKSIQVRTVNDLFLFKRKFEVINHPDHYDIPVNLQYAEISDNNDLLISHFHGIWYPKTKSDSPDRINQCRKINKFLENFHCRKIICGDFNLLPDTLSMKIMETNMKNLIKDYHITSTRNLNYKRDEKFADYMLVSADVKVKSFHVAGVEVSDHLPLILEFDS
jgi:hypothetical protein